MREFEFDKWQVERKAMMRQHLALKKERLTKRRLFPEDKQLVLSKLITAKREQMISSGVLTIAGPRLFIFRFDKENRYGLSIE